MEFLINEVIETCLKPFFIISICLQIYCFDAITLENKFSVLTYPVPQLGVQGIVGGVNIGYGPMAIGSKWLAYASNNPLLSNAGRLSPQSLTPPGVSPSTSPGSGSLVARYAMESSKQLATGLFDMGYKTLSKYYQDFIPDGSSSPVSSSGWKVGRESDIAGMVSRLQLRNHNFVALYWNVMIAVQNTTQFIPE